MKQQVYQVPIAGGVATSLPQNPMDAGVAENVFIDKPTGGWSTRVGYEPWIPSATSWTPFGNTGPVYALHVAQALSGGGRQTVLYEADGNLFLLYELEGVDSVVELADNRHIPTATEPGAWFTDTAYGTVITNGVDRPLLVRPWPLPGTSHVASAAAQCVRPFGFQGLPTPVEPRVVKPMPAPPSFGPPKASGNGAVTLWCPSDGQAIPDGGRWGLGFANNVGGDSGDKEALFGWAVSFITDTGSEGPVSTLQSTRWGLPADAEGFRHACALDIPIGPPGTVARKLYRTSNYSDDFVNDGDTTLYFIDTIRNNVEPLFFDAVNTANLGQPSPAIATGPLPAPQARFSALFAGCLWLDGGVNDGRTLYYSTIGLIEQFAADAFIELSARGGSVTALFSHYNTLLVFRERGIDIVQGTYKDGFQVTTLTEGVTCRAPHTIAAVPGLGIVFLAVDGVYAVIGGLTGGAVNEVINLTIPQEEFIQTFTQDCHPKAVGCYSELTREYHVYVPTGGNDRPDRGLVLHVDRLAREESLSAWTTRKGFPVGAIATLYDGTIIFGHNTGAEAGGSQSQRGLFVISHKRSLGMEYNADPQPVLEYTSPPTSIYRSAWTAFGDPQLMKQVSYVTLWVMTTGKPQIQMRHYKDFSLVPTLERTYTAQSPDSIPQVVLDGFQLGTGDYRIDRLVPLRFSVAHQSAAWFCFEIETTEDLVLVGYEYEYTTKGTRVVAGVVA